MPPPPNNKLDWASLIPEIERIARSVGRRKNATPRVKDELIGLAVGFVYEKSGYFDPSKGAFGAWCQRLLENKCVDLIRREAGDGEGIERLTSQLEDGAWNSWTHEEKEEEPLPSIDWPAVVARAKLNPMDCLLFVLDVELWARFSPDVITGWITAAGLPKNFPLRQLQETAERARNQALAIALLEAAGVEPTTGAIKKKQNWIRTRLFRIKNRLGPDIRGQQ
jgi:hypothetical protein